MTGTVLFYNRRQGWGFALPDDGGDDVFLHYTHLLDCRFLRKDDCVEFQYGHHDGRACAIDIRITKAAAPTDGQLASPDSKKLRIGVSVEVPYRKLDLSALTGTPEQGDSRE